MKMFASDERRRRRRRRRPAAASEKPVVVSAGARRRTGTTTRNVVRGPAPPPTAEEARASEQLFYREKAGHDESRLAIFFRRPLHITRVVFVITMVVFLVESTEAESPMQERASGCLGSAVGLYATVRSSL